MGDREPTVLVVDNEPSIRSTLTKLLISCGFQATEEGNALAVVRRVSQEKPDVILLDLKMPGADGFQIVRSLRRANLNVPVVILSGYLDEQAVRMLRDMGVKHMLSKPASEDKLKEMIRNALVKKKARPSSAS